MCLGLSFFSFFFTTMEETENNKDICMFVLCFYFYYLFNILFITFFIFSFYLLIMYLFVTLLYIKFGPNMPLICFYLFIYLGFVIFFTRKEFSSG